MKMRLNWAGALALCLTSAWIVSPTIGEAQSRAKRSIVPRRTVVLRNTSAVRNVQTTRHPTTPQFSVNARKWPGPYVPTPIRWYPHAWWAESTSYTYGMQVVYYWRNGWYYPVVYPGQIGRAYPVIYEPRS